MTLPTASIREKLHQLINTVDDKKAEAIYTLLTDDADAEEQRRKRVQAEREAYLRGEGKCFSVQEVKEMAMNQEKRHAL